MSALISRKFETFETFVTPRTLLTLSIDCLLDMPLSEFLTQIYIWRKFMSLLKHWMMIDEKKRAFALLDHRLPAYPKALLRRQPMLPSSMTYLLHSC